MSRTSMRAGWEGRKGECSTPGGDPEVAHAAFAEEAPLLNLRPEYRQTPQDIVSSKAVSPQNSGTTMMDLP